MALEDFELGNVIRAVIVTSRKHWELREAIPDANTTATPVDDQELADCSASGIVNTRFQKCYLLEALFPSFRHGIMGKQLIFWVVQTLASDSNN